MGLSPGAHQDVFQILVTLSLGLQQRFRAEPGPAQGSPRHGRRPGGTPPLMYRGAYRGAFRGQPASGKHHGEQEGGDDGQQLPAGTAQGMGHHHQKEEERQHLKKQRDDQDAGPQTASDPFQLSAPHSRTAPLPCLAEITRMQPFPATECAFESHWGHHSLIPPRSGGGEGKDALPYILT